MSVEVKDGVLYSDGVAIYEIPEAEHAPANGPWVAKNGTFFMHGVAYYRLNNPKKVQRVVV